MYRKIRKRPNLTQILIFYIFSVLYSQIIELLLPFSITKLFVGSMLLLIIYGIVNGKICCRHIVFPLLVLESVYVIVYYSFGRNYFGYVYPPLIVALVGILMLDNLPRDSFDAKQPYINYLIFVYLLINLLMYVVKWTPCFQDAGGSLQFKGALPHTNMFGGVLFSLYIVLFWQRSRIAILNKAFIFILTLATYSRTYILVILLCIIIQIIDIVPFKTPFLTKFVLGSIFTLTMGISGFFFMVEYVPAFSRFKNFHFGGNGRQYLQAAYWETIKDSKLWEKMLGFPMVNKYQNNISLDFSHSFTENSYVALFLLFGIFGLVMILYFLFRIFGFNHHGPVVCLIVLVMLTLVTQDTMLSVQLGIMTLFSVIIMQQQNKKLFKRRR